jgi:membrane-bound lytic murein transglycosylase B
MHQKGWRKGKITAASATFKGKRFRGLRVGFKTRYTLASLRKHGIKPKTHYPYRTASLIRLRNKTHDELWLGAPNFRVLTAYNASSNYGMAITMIARSLKK